MEHVAGYMNIQDMTARDLILPEGEPWMHLQMGRAKGFDGSSPCGPWLLTADEVADPQDLEIWMWVNDELRQKGSTSRHGRRHPRPGRERQRRVPAAARRHPHHRYTRPGSAPR